MAQSRPLDLEFSDRAIAQLEAIDDYIRPRNEMGADKVLQRINEICRLLTQRPYIGRPILPLGTRAIGVSAYPYLVIYEVRGEPARVMYVLAVFHTAQGERRL